MTNSLPKAVVNELVVTGVELDWAAALETSNGAKVVPLYANITARLPAVEPCVKDATVSVPSDTLYNTTMLSPSTL
jgi:hypothetical protein